MGILQRRATLVIEARTIAELDAARQAYRAQLAIGGKIRLTYYEIRKPDA